MADVNDLSLEEHEAISRYDRQQEERERELRPTRRNVRLYLFRHGESTANEVTTHVGGRASHATLSKKGEDQSARLGGHLNASGLKFDLVFSSTSTRARQTAEIVCRETGLDPSAIVTTDQILEQCHGGWEGKARAEVYTPEVLAAQEKNIWRFRPPGLSPDGLESESPKMVEERMMKFVEENILAKQPGDPPEKKTWNVAIFGHGLAIKFFTRSIMQSSRFLSRKIRIDNTAIVEFGYESASGSKGGWHLIRINDHAHIKDEKLYQYQLPSTPKAGDISF